MVAQPVEHQLGQFPGGGDDADVAAAPLPDPVADLPEPGVAADALPGLDRGPADQARTLFRDRAAVHRGVGLASCSGDSADMAEVRRLRAEVAELRRANEILKTASAFFASAELDRRLK